MECLTALQDELPALKRLGTPAKQEVLPAAVSEFDSLACDMIEQSESLSYKTKRAHSRPLPLTRQSSRR